MNPIHSTEGLEPEAPVSGSGEAGGSASEVAGSFREVLGGLVGRRVVLADPQSLEEVPVGHTLMVKITPARVLRCTEDAVCVVRRFTHRNPRKRGDEPMHQWIPLPQIKEVSFRGDDIVLHL